MGRLAVMLGSNALGPEGEALLAAAAERDVAVMQRHGGRAPTPCLIEIDHAANMRALLEQGCDRVLAIGSVGSLSAELAGRHASSARTTSSPSTRPSAFDDARAHRRRGSTASGGSRCSPPGRPKAPELRDGGVYWQATARASRPPPRSG